MSKIHTGSEIIEQMRKDDNLDGSDCDFEVITLFKKYLKGMVVVPEEKWLQIEKARKIIKDLLENDGYAVRLCRADIKEILILLSSEEELSNMVEGNKEPHNPEETSFVRGDKR